MRWMIVVGMLGLILAGCAGAVQGPQASPTPLTASAPTLAAPAKANPAALKYQLMAAFGGMGSDAGIFYCDQAEFPVAGPDSADQASRQFDQIRGNAEEFQAIIDQLALAGVTAFSTEQKQAIYREHKKLSAIVLQPDGPNFRFSLAVRKNQLVTTDAQVDGLITPAGAITIEQQIAADNLAMGCPICLAASTLIDTPSGPVLVTKLHPGMLVWTVGQSGARVARPLIRVGSVPAPKNHRVVHLRLADGREVWVSPGHPSAAGRLIGELEPGDSLDHAQIISAALVEYLAPATYDVLPAGPTGSYWANGILLDSTLGNRK